MSEGVQTVLISGVVSLLVAVVGVYGVRFTARQSTKAKQEEADLKRKEVDAAAYDRAEKSWERITSGLEKEIARVSAALEHDRAVHRQELSEQDERHRAQIAELREERREQLTALNQRLDELEEQRSEMETQRTEDRRSIAALTAYIRRLTRLLRDNQITPPPVPEGMDIDFG